MFRSVMTGMFCCVLGAFPAAALVALVWGFPVPFAGHRSGPGAIGPVLIAVFMYEVIGGFLVLAFLGALAGAIAHRLTSSDERKLTRMIIGLSLGADLLVAIVMSSLKF